MAQTAKVKSKRASSVQPPQGQEKGQVAANSQPPGATATATEFYTWVDAQVRKTMLPVKQMVKLTIYDGGFHHEELPVYNGLFALQTHPTAKYNLLHLSSGLIAAYVPTKREALRLIYLWTRPESGIDWQIVNDIASLPPEQAPQIRRIYTAVRNFQKLD